MPRWWCIPLAVAGGVVAGCATRPHPQPEYARTEQKVRLAAGRMESRRPAQLPTEPTLEGEHPVDFYVQFALERNPEILAARREVAARAEAIPQVTALEDPVLVDTFQPIDSNSVQTAAGRGPNTLTLSQKFPWLSKLRLRGEVAEQETAMALSRLAQAELKVVEAVHLAYYEIAFNEAAIRITEEDQALLEDLLKIAEARYRVNQTSQQDVLRAQVELEKLRDRLITLRRQLRVAQADLASLLHTGPDSELQAVSATPVASAPERIEELYDLAVRCRPELQERFQAIVRDQRVRELAEQQYYPDFTAGVGWQAITTDSAVAPSANGNDNVGFTIGLTLPVWRDKLAAGVRQSEHMVVRSARKYDATRDDTFRQIRRYVVQAEAIEQQLTLFRESIVPKAEQTLRVSTADYRVGEVDFLQVVDNFSELLLFQLQVARLEASLQQTLASLERVVGCRLATGEDDPGTLPRPEPGPLPQSGGNEEQTDETSEAHSAK